MPDRPTPEQVLAGYSTHRTDDDPIRALRDAGMVVGYPNDPEIIKAVLPHIQKDLLRFTMANLPAMVTTREMRRAVLAALPEEPPIEFHAANSFGSYRSWRWLREEAFK